MESQSMLVNIIMIYGTYNPVSCRDACEIDQNLLGTYYNNNFTLETTDLLRIGNNRTQYLNKFTHIKISIIIFVIEYFHALYMVRFRLFTMYLRANVNF